MKKHSSKSTRQQDEAFQKLSRSYYQPKKTVEDTLPAAQDTPTEQSKKKRLNIKGAILTFIIVACLVVVGIVTWNLINFSTASSKLFGSANVLGLFSPTRLDKTVSDRVNILIVGYSADDKGHAGAELTDSILVMSIDTKEDRGYMLSIPRDMYVNIPDYGMAKINEAYQAGERSDFNESGYPSGGIGLLQKTIAESFGLNFQYYAIVNYAAVRDTVDALGGITVTIDSSDPRGLYDPNFQPHEGGPLKLANGVHTIDGETALKLTRARGAAGNSYGFAESDFVRTKHQQMVVSAITDQLSWTLILDPRTNGQIFSAVGNNVLTDIEMSEVIPMARLLMRTPTESLTSVSLRDFNDQNLLQSYRTPSGQSALIPAAGMYDYSQIEAALKSLE